MTRRTILMDIDGTLLSAGGSGKTALTEAVRTGFDIDPPDAELQFGGRTDRSLVDELLRRNALAVTAENRDRLIGAFVRRFESDLAVAGGHVYPGAVEVMRQLHRCCRTRCHVMTGNLTATAAIKLRHFGLDRYVDQIFGGDVRGNRNDLARDALAAVGPHRPGDLWVVGDTPADIHCGQAIGASTMAVCTGSGTPGRLAAASPTVLLPDLADVDAVLRCLLP